MQADVAEGMLPSIQPSQPTAYKHGAAWRCCRCHRAAALPSGGCSPHQACVEHYSAMPAQLDTLLIADLLQVFLLARITGVE